MASVGGGRLIARGAEAELYLQRPWLDREVLVKRRVRKRYRVPELDRRLREYRTVREAEIIHRAKELGVPTPVIYLIDIPRTTVYMEYVRGRRLRELLDELPREERLDLFHRVGVLVGRLHRGGIIHGDLTTSNMILTEDGRICFVDFGLAEVSEEVERRGVDLHLMRRMLISTHYGYAAECFQSFLQGYREVMGDAATEEVVRKMREIERRGRYVSERVEDGDG